MTPEQKTAIGETLQKLRALEKFGTDGEAAHVAADDLLVSFLRKMGFVEIADEFEKQQRERGFYHA